jgi:hypothetical protein
VRIRECVVTIRQEGAIFTWDAREVGMTGTVTHRGTAHDYDEAYEAALARVEAMGTLTRGITFFTISPNE